MLDNVAFDVNRFICTEMPETRSLSSQKSFGVLLAECRRVASVATALLSHSCLTATAVFLAPAG